MEKMFSCAYNMDSGCVEARFLDGTMIAVYCKAVATTMDANVNWTG